MRALAAHYAQALPPEELRKTLGPAAEKLRQAEVERVQSQPGRKAQSVASAASMPKDIRTPRNTAGSSERRTASGRGSGEGGRKTEPESGRLTPHGR